MDFRLSEDQTQIRDTVRAFAEKEFAPHGRAWDAAGEMPKDAIAQLAELGFFAMLVPEEYGGAAYDAISYGITLEELARVSAALSVIVSVHNSVCAAPIAKFGTEAQKKRFLPLLATGEALGAFSLSEPNAGSDAGALQTSAKKDGDAYVLNGTKNWVTNGADAGVILLFARTTPGVDRHGISAFLITPDLPGFSVGKHEDKTGIRASVTVELALQDCRVPADRLLGPEGEGFKIAMSTLDGGRIGIAAQALGIAQAAFEAAVRHAKVRETFGKKLYEHQPVANHIAEMERRVAAARLLVRQAAWRRDRGLPHTLEASMAKLYASQTATDVTHRAVQIHGGYGYVKEYDVERFARDARVTEIYEGASEIQRIVIARELLRAAEQAAAAPTVEAPR
jgi:alkylation response protein AidB-like acyl-CoA dehydrogenase